MLCEVLNPAATPAATVQNPARFAMRQSVLSLLGQLTVTTDQVIPNRME
jgi:hypothetical protein